MFQEVDAALKAYISHGVGELVPEKNISFEVPDMDFKPVPSGINCWLYTVNENQEMRSNTWACERAADNTAMMTRSPYWLNCEYLVTAWADTIEEEHKLLGSIFTSLLRLEINHATPDHPISSKVDTSKIRLRNNQNNRLEINELWKGLGVKPKLGLAYTLICSIDKQDPMKVDLMLTGKINMSVSDQVKPAI